MLKGLVPAGDTMLPARRSWRTKKPVPEDRLFYRQRVSQLIRRDLVLVQFVPDGGDDQGHDRGQAGLDLL